MIIAKQAEQQTTLKSYVERVETLEEERKAIGSDVRDVLTQAKGDGYDVKTIRKVVRERSMDAADVAEQETLLDTYRHALGMGSYREVAEQFGISKSKLHRLVPKNDRGTSREMTADDLGEWLPAHDADTGELPREMIADDLGDPLWVVDRERAKFRDKVRSISASIKPPKQEPRIEGAGAAGPIPPGLDRRHELVRQ